MNKKYFFFDIDGTLTTGGMDSIIPESARDCIKALRAQGNFVGIATGRPHAMSKDVAKDLDISSFICNGGNTVIYNDEKVMNESLDQEHVRVLIQDCLDLDFPFCISQKDDFYFLTRDLSRIPQGKDDFISQFIKEADFEPSTLKNVKRLLVYVSREDQKKLHKFDDLVPQRYDDEFVMVEPDDKFKGIAFLMNAMKAPIEDVVVFGDGDNDLKMFRQAPISIAVGNAVDDLKELASFVTKRSDEDGIQYACQHYGWIKK